LDNDRQLRLDTSGYIRLDPNCVSHGSDSFGEKAAS
jgi:hypothetical protein